jgi:hypothetical protein
LRWLLILDALFLAMIGFALILAPEVVRQVCHFPVFPVEVRYLLAMWGSVLATMSLGYTWAATDPVRNVSWIKVAIARGLLEFVVGLGFILTHVTTVGQAGLGTASGLLVAGLYLVLYPREGR